ncbi:MAG: hypothetical protein GY820_35170 [Gammaproteobacteria bacterium]|nr:hypothetical protein [Gammaproteobacteria bacterium]
MKNDCGLISIRVQLCNSNEHVGLLDPEHVGLLDPEYVGLLDPEYIGLLDPP